MAFKHNTSDTADGILTQGEYESTSGHILDSQAAGDMIVADTTTTMTRLAVGSADEVLTSDGSTPTYSKITTSNINASTLVIESEGIGSNDNDTTIPTSAAVKDYVDTNVTAQDLDFTGDSGGPSAVDLDSQTLTISGTANEIETSVSGQTLTVGIVTNPTIGGNLTVTGDLTVNGTTTTVDTTNTVIQDPLIELNTGAASNANDLGIVMERGSTGDNAIIAWDESADGFIVGTTTATGASTGDLTIAAAPLTASTLTSDVITVDTINETTAAGGVTIDSVLLKDDTVTVGNTVLSNSKIDAQTDGLVVDLAGFAPDPDLNVFHIWAGSAGSVTADSIAIAVIESNGNATLNFLTPDTAIQGIEFGIASDNDYSSILARNDLSGDPLVFTVATAEALRLDSSQDATFAGEVLIADGEAINFGVMDGSQLGADLTTDQVVFNLGTDVGAQFIFGAYQGNARDYDHAATSGNHPTLYVHSATDPNTANDEWWSVHHNGTNGVMALGSGGLVLPTASAYIGDTANANMTVGLTINQGANDNQILAFKSSDVSTGLTTGTIGNNVEEDDYATYKKESSTGGGLETQILAESSRDLAARYEYYSGAPSTTDTTSSLGVANWFVAEHDGSNGLNDMAANSNGFAWGEIPSGGGRITRMLLKADDGELHLGNTTLVALDDQPDAIVARAMQKISASSGIIETEHDNPMYDYQWLLERGLVGEADENGDFLFPLQPRLHLHEGAIWQNYTLMKSVEQKHMSLAEEVKSLKAEIKALTEGR